MAKLVYNEREMGWECSVCGGLYSADELSRVFEYETSDLDEQRNYKRDIASHCMDCGCLWTEIDPNPEIRRNR